MAPDGRATLRSVEWGLGGVGTLGAGCWLGGILGVISWALRAWLFLPLASLEGRSLGVDFICGLGKVLAVGIEDFSSSCVFITDEIGGGLVSKCVACKCRPVSVREVIAEDVPGAPASATHGSKLVPLTNDAKERCVPAQNLGSEYERYGG